MHRRFFGISCLRSAVALALILGQSPSPAAEPAPIRVALYFDEGASGKGLPKVVEILTRAGGFDLTLFKAANLPGALARQEVVIFTGGQSDLQGLNLGEAGRKSVQDFVRDGGGYFGICAGGYLACSGYPWSLGLLNARTVSPKWRRGAGMVQIEGTTLGQTLFHLPSPPRGIRYVNGPIIQPTERHDLPVYESLAVFRSELTQGDAPAGTMIDSPAMVRATFGRGRVFTSSPHPEQTPGFEPLVVEAIHWAAGRTDR